MTAAISRRIVTASLLKQATWAVRIAYVFRVLASNLFETFDKCFGNLFLQRQVEGMPDPGEGYNRKSRNAEKTLPPGYFGGFGRKVFVAFVKKYYPSQVEDAMAEVMANFSIKPDKINAGTTLNSATAYVMQAVRLELYKLTAKKKIEVRTPQDEEGTDIEGVDEDSLEEIEETMAPTMWRRMLNELDVKVAPWASMYILGILEGYSDQELIGDVGKGIPSLVAQKLGLGDYLQGSYGNVLSMASWSKSGGFKDKIRHLIFKFVKESKENAHYK